MNLFGIRQKLAPLIKKTRTIFNFGGKKFLSKKQINIQIAQIIQGGKPAMVCRCGHIELRLLDYYLNQKDTDYPNELLFGAINNSGIFPAKKDLIDRFCTHYYNCIQQADVMGVWGIKIEKQILSNNKQIVCGDVEGIEPYYFDEPWSQYLEGKKVLVVSSFAESILEQYQKRDVLFDNKKILPKFKSLECIKAVTSFAGEKTEFGDWFKALDYMQQQISKCDFDVAIVGAGAYSLPLCQYIKSIGKISIQLSGATQILFGIKGKRWEYITPIKKLFNDNWTRPKICERPKNFISVEDGCYW